MEIEAFNQGQRPFEENPLARAKSSVRMHYEAQVEVIKRQLGDLEKIRQNLGLSQRKICQLLMVDPSAWTRWVKNNENTPPHIYRALQWYMILQEKLPGLTPQYFVGKDPEVLHQTALRKIEAEALKRSEFEDAIAVQAMKLEDQILGLNRKNIDLTEANFALKRKVEVLQRSIRGVAIFIAVLSLGVWFFTR
jgi:transcriptional regulator with XRE-family HTH domain